MTHPARQDRPFPSLHRLALFLAGVAAGALFSGATGAAAVLACATGLALVATFRACEGRAQADERRIRRLNEENRRLSAETDRLERLHDGMGRLAAAVTDAFGHPPHTQHRVQELAEAIGRQLGLDDATRAALRSAALLKDVGTLAVPASVWSKPDALTPSEWEQVRAHPTHGEGLVSGATLPRAVADIVRAHHERWDGSGYPDGLSADAIPLPARVLAVADAYAAMTSPRPYRPALSHAQALDRLSSAAGRQFDPRVVAALRAAASHAAFMPLLPSDEASPEMEKTRWHGATGFGADERI